MTKKIVFLAITVMVILTAAAPKARAQTSYYGETFEKDTGKMRSRTWVSMSKMRSRSETVENGKVTGVSILDMKTLKTYDLNMEKKTYRIIDAKAIADGSIFGVESMKVTDRKSERTVLGKETIEGYECTHYGVSTSSTTKGGQTDSGQYSEWVWEPHGITIQVTDEMRFGNFLVTRNIKLGEPPANLLEIPKDFTEVKTPDMKEMGKMLEMLQGGKK